MIEYEGKNEAANSLSRHFFIVGLRNILELHAQLVALSCLVKVWLMLAYLALFPFILMLAYAFYGVLGMGTLMLASTLPLIYKMEKRERQAAQMFEPMKVDSEKALKWFIEEINHN